MKDKKCHQICVVSGTRAEYGLLRPLLFKLQEMQDVLITLVVTGAHLSETFGNTQAEIIKDGFTSFVRIPIPMEDDSKEGMAHSAGVALSRFAELFRTYKPDIMVVLGDRFEIFGAVAAAHLTGIPVAHISGGDVTEGAVDDAIRHSITKMSNLHFPGCKESARRIIQMGEQPDRVHNVGEPGVENCLKMQLLSLGELEESLGFPYLKQDYSVVTFHPVTMENSTEKEQLYELISAMDAVKNMSYIITMANADAGGRTVNEIWMEEGKKHSNWMVVQSLGVLRYLSAVKHAKLAIGNSSSGIYEAPALGTPTVNIGDRQKGRMMAESIISCEPKKDKIIEAIHTGLESGFQEKALHGQSPFGDGSTSDQIAKHIILFLNNEERTTQKRFYDIPFMI